MNDTMLTVCEITVWLLRLSMAVAAVYYGFLYLATDVDPYFWIWLICLCGSIAVHAICRAGNKARW